MTDSAYLATTSAALRVLFDAQEVYFVETRTGVPAAWRASRKDLDPRAEATLRAAGPAVGGTVTRPRSSPLGRYQLALTPTPSCRTWLLVRDDRDFGDDDVRRGESVCPLLTAVDRMIPSLGGTATLSPREREVIELLVTGCTARRMASILGISPRTVGKHLQNAYDKLGHHDRLLIATQRARPSP